jgi:hypothetical protein
MFWRHSLVVAGVVLVSLAVPAQPQRARTEGSSPVDAAGTIRKPVNFEKDYINLGTEWTLDEKDGDRISTTFASPGTVEAFQKSGQFADGSVLVQQVSGTERDPASVQQPRLAAGTTEWFVMVRDTRGRFQNQLQWGDGWGWALFRSDIRGERVSVNYTRDCKGCHAEAKASDRVFVNRYEKLKAK